MRRVVLDFNGPVKPRGKFRKVGLMTHEPVDILDAAAKLARVNDIIAERLKHATLDDLRAAYVAALRKELTDA